LMEEEEHMSGRTDYLCIGSAPSDEECAQVGSEGYARRAKAECAAFINQLRRVFGGEPDGARLRTKSNAHDYGTYFEVVCDYEEENQKALDYALKVEGETPQEWDDEARKELAEYLFAKKRRA
jgi:hypothetical protein